MTLTEVLDTLESLLASDMNALYPDEKEAIRFAIDVLAAFENVETYRVP